MGDFNVGALLKLGAAKLGPKLVELGKGELRKLLKHEQAQGVKARANMVQLLQAELEGRAGQLEDASIMLIAKAQHNAVQDLRELMGADAPPEGTWDDLQEASRSGAAAMVTTVLANPSLEPESPAQLVSFSVIRTLAPIFDTIEEMAETIAELSGGGPREQVGPGAIAELRPPADGEAQGKLLDRVVELAFCEGKDIMFKLAAEGADFIAGLGKVAFGKAVTLKRDKRRVRIDQVVALDAEGRPIARCRMMQPLEGGGGRQALFPARSISFDL